MTGHGSKQETKNIYHAYIELWDAFQKQGCPICALVEKQDQIDVDEMTNKYTESSEEYTVHGEAIAGCNRHIRKIWAGGFSGVRHRIMGDALQVEEGDLKEVLREYEESSLRLMMLHKLRWKRSPVNRLLRRMNRCRLCQNMVRAEAHYLEILLNNMTELDFSAEFRRSKGLCFPHAVKALAKFPHHRNALLMIEVILDKIKIRRMELSEAAHYYGRQGIEGAEIDFQQRILEMIAGRKEAYHGPVESEKDYAREMGDHGSLMMTIDEPVEDDGDGNPRSVTEKLKFEIDKLQRQNEKLRSDYVRESARAAALNYRYWECNEDNKRLTINLTGARAKLNAYVEHVERLNEEIRKLKETLTNREAGKDVTRNYE